MALTLLKHLWGFPFYFETESKVSHVVYKVYGVGVCTPAPTPHLRAPPTPQSPLNPLQDTQVIFWQGTGMSYALCLGALLFSAP